MVTRIDSFHLPEYRFLSNFYPAEIRIGPEAYITLEHAYQAMKFVYWEDRLKVARQPTPGHAKRFARTHTGLRYPDFHERKLDLMERLLRKKFRHFSQLGDMLLATGDAELIEGNTWGDTFWGVCAGTGYNHLGRLLMERRAALRPTNLEDELPLDEETDQ